MNYPIITQIIENKLEAKNTKTITFRFPGEMLPGQFFMIWIPKVDEIPMSVSYINKDIKGFTYRKIGDATKALYNLKKGDKIGIKGPYGNGFKINGKHIMFVGGGTGIGMLIPAIEEAVNKKIKSTIILGVKNKEELFFEKRLKKLNVELYISTDDGSRGYKGYASDIAKNLINKNNYTSILTCGPETMMKKILEISKSTPFQASMERYMKCGFGICGQCTIGNGIRVCQEGPIFDGETLKKIEDFGKFKKDSSGRKIPI